MNILITSFLTPQSSHRYNFFSKTIGNFWYYVASDLCENYPYDLNLAALKNKCIKAARILKPDWMILLSGIDAQIIKLPDFKKLDEDVLYIGKKFDVSDLEVCSNWILSKKIYEKYEIDEAFSCYGWEDWDFIYNNCKDLKKEVLENFITRDLPPENPILIKKNSYCHEIFFRNKQMFLDKYKSLHGCDFQF